MTTGDTVTKLLLTVTDAATAVSVSPQYLRAEWIAGRIDFVSVGTGRRPAYRIAVTELERWVAARPAAIPGRAS